MKEMVLFCICFVIVSLVYQTQGSHCPDKYLRFSVHHSYCKDPNPDCGLIKKKVEQKDVKVILNVHNELRSKIATGKEKRAGNLPEASNMLQMEWDDELASIAQKHASQCEFDHDCDECRAVENFAVGQNLYESSDSCSDEEQCLHLLPDWKAAIMGWYDEIDSFHKSQLKTYVFSHEVGHFTQVIWAGSWRIGCGYAFFKNGEWYKRLYVCNYGPAGNILENPIYDEGKPCSKCPSNSCCGASCKLQRTSYPGLCRMMNLLEGPSYTTEAIAEGNKDHYHCDMRPGNPYCKAQTTGDWRFLQSLDGWYGTITLKGGEKATMELNEAYTPRSGKFCLRVRVRKGPVSAANEDASYLKLSFEIDGYSKIMDMELNGKPNKYQMTKINLSWNERTKMIFEYSVPEDEPAHTLDIKDIDIQDGACKKG